MNTRKLCGTVAAAIFTLALSGPVMASDSPYFHCPDGTTLDVNDEPILFSQENVAQALEDMAVAMRCYDYISAKDGVKAEGTWDTKNPIWRWGKNKNGCEVHYSLTKLLHVARDPNSPPPKIKGGKNLAQGAANDVRDNKFVRALEQLTLLTDSMAYSANAVNEDAQKQENAFQASTEAAYLCVLGL